MSPTEAARRRARWILRFCAAAVVVSLGISAWTLVRQSQLDAVRTADRKAAAAAQVAGCYQQVDNAPRVLRILGLIDILASNSITANRQALATSPADDPLRPVREASLERLVPARDDLRGFIATTKKQAPTDASCRKLAGVLGVNPARPKGA